MKKRILALILASLMLMASCTANVEDGEKDNESQTNDTADNTPVEEKTAYELEIERRNGISDELPEITFDGEEFVIYGSDQLDWYNVAEGYLGETFNDSVYERNLRIASRFDIDLNIMPELTGDPSATMANSVKAGIDEYDLISSQCIVMGMDLTDEIFLDFRTVPYVNFEQPWWNSSTDELLTVNNRTFLAVGAFNLSAIGSMKVVFYNNDVAMNHQLEDIFDVVYDGRWTLDTMEQITTGMYTDINANGEKDTGDGFGYAWSGDDLLYYQYAFGKTFAEKDEAGNIVTDRYYDEKLVAICDKLWDYIKNRQDMHFGTSALGVFMQGNTLCGASLIRSYDSLLNTDIDFAVIPLPKWDENQERYLTTVDGACDVQAVLKTAKNLEMVGVVTEALNADTWKNVEYAYYEKVLKNRGLQDPRNLEVMDMIIEGRVFDFGYIYGGWSWCTNGGGASDWLYSMMVMFNMNNITSWVSARINKWTRYINSMVDVFVNYKE